MITRENLLINPDHAELRDRSEQFVLAFLAFANVFDLGGGFGLKYLSYVFCALLRFARRNEVRMSRPVFLVCATLFVVWPLFSALQGTTQDSNLGRAIQRITAFAPALMVMPILATTRQPRFLLDAIMKSLLIMAVVVIFLFCLWLLLPQTGIATFLLATLHGDEYGVHGYFGARGVGSILVPVVYFKATLFLVPASIWFFFRRNHLASGICFLGLICAFSRAGVLIAGAMLALHGFILAPLRVRVGLACLLLVVAYVLWRNAELLHIGAVLDMYLDVMTGRGHSSTERIGHFNSIMELLGHDAMLLWFGQGAGTYFFSSGVNSFVSAVELDHLDAIRTFGLLWFIGFTLVVMRAAGLGMRLVSNEARGLRVALVASFLASGTNPVLISPLFCMLAAVSYYVLLKEHQAQPDRDDRTT